MRTVSSKVEQILDAAYQCLAEKGSANVTTRDISRLSGVTLSLIHYHFPNKEELLVAAASNAIKREISILNTELSEVTSLKTRVSKIIHFIRKRFEFEDTKWRKVYFDLLAQSAWSSEIAARVRKLQDDLIGSIVSSSNEYLVDVIDVTAFSRVFLAALNGLALQYLHGTSKEQLDYAYDYLEKILISQCQD